VAKAIEWGGTIVAALVVIRGALDATHGIVTRSNHPQIELPNQDLFLDCWPLNQYALGNDLFVHSGDLLRVLSCICAGLWVNELS
jgi:hypothetical protein